MINPIYDRKQIIFSLNSIANTPSMHKGTVPEFEAYANKVITEVFSNASVKNLIGEWELVWGPVVNQEPNSKVADNAMYVAQNRSNSNDIVVAISGTNPISKYGWVYEDFRINPMQEWPFMKIDPQAKISNGTMLGLNVLMQMVDVKNKQTITDFLKERVNSNTSNLLVTITGHSLGGALSPALALALKNLQGNKNSWDPETTANIAVLPSAGPTSGNKDWANYFDTQLGNSTTRIWNKIDIVPHAWELDMLNEITTLYVPEIPESKFIKLVAKFAKANSIKAGNMHQIRDDVEGLPGIVDIEILLNISNIIEMLEDIIANKLIELLAKEKGLKPIEVVLIKEFIAELIKLLNHKLKSVETITKAHLKPIQLQAGSKLRAHSTHISENFINFLDFLVQAGYQHTSAYAKLVGTNLFADLVSEIKKGIPFPITQ